MRHLQQRTRLGIIAGASFVLLVLVLPQVATGIGLGGLASRIVNSGSCGSSGSSGSSGSGSGSSSTCGPATLTAKPDKGLADGQSILVTGADFTPSSGVGIVECERGATGPEQCDLSTLYEVQSNGSGSFTTPYTVSRIINISGGIEKAAARQKTIDCAVSPCILGAADISDYAIAGKTPLSFNVRSPLALTGTVAATDSVVPHTGVAHISGTATCLHSAGAAQVSVYLQQIYKRFNFTNSGYKGFRCVGHTTWTVTVPPGIGLFAPGKARVRAEISTEIGTSYRTITIARGVVLQAAPPS
jgi:hypothetical protein